MTDSFGLHAPSPGVARSLAVANRYHREVAPEREGSLSARTTLVGTSRTLPMSTLCATHLTFMWLMARQLVSPRWHGAAVLWRPASARARRQFRECAGTG